MAKINLTSISYIFEVENIFWSITLMQHNKISDKWLMVVFQVQNPDKKISGPVQFEGNEPNIHKAESILKYVLMGKIK